MIKFPNKLVFDLHPWVAGGGIVLLPPFDVAVAIAVLLRTLTRKFIRSLHYTQVDKINWFNIGIKWKKRSDISKIRRKKRNDCCKQKQKC